MNRRRTLKSTGDGELAEEINVKVEEEVEANEIVKIPEALLAYHDKLPFFDEEKVSPSVPIRKIQREIFAVDEDWRSPHSMDFFESRQSSQSDSHRSSALQSSNQHSIPSNKEDKRVVTLYII